MQQITNYAIDRAKQAVEKEVKNIIGADAEVRIEYPPQGIDAHLAVPCFLYSKTLRKAPNQISCEIAEKIGKIGIIANTEAAGGYLNIKLDPKGFASEIFGDIEKYGELYGNSAEGNGQTVVIDYSSPNIAKPFSVGNIRSTIIGQSIYNIFKAMGYKVIGDNHLGDWGTQFGKLIYAYELWGNDEKIKKDPIKELLDLYVKFHQEAKTDEEESDSENPMEQEARKRFKMLEEGNPEMVRLWKWFVDISIQEFDKIYDRLGIKFDYALGESFYNDKTEGVIKMIEKAGIAERDPDGALLVRLDNYGIPTPLLIQKSDGATLYSTRDLAALIYRICEFHPRLILYVVGSEQKLHFKQCFKVMELLGYTDTQYEHIDFGLVSLKDGKMSTRQGRVIFFEDVLEEGRQRALAILSEKRPDLPDEERNKIAEVVGIGAIKFNDLSQTRIKNVVFDWDKMLSFDGDTAPYLQYSYARVRSILRKSEILPESNPELLIEKEEQDLLFSIAKFPEIIRESAAGFAPHVIAQYLLETARVFTSFYQAVPVLKAADEKLVKARLSLIEAYSMVIKKGLYLLGIDVLERM